MYEERTSRGPAVAIEDLTELPFLKQHNDFLISTIKELSDIEARLINLHAKLFGSAPDNAEKKQEVGNEPNGVVALFQSHKAVTMRLVTRIAELTSSINRIA